MSRPTCKGTRKDGRPCRATPGVDGFCASHSPRFDQAERSEWGRRGSLVHQAKSVGDRLESAQADLAAVAPKGDGRFVTAASTRGYLEGVAARLDRGEIPPASVHAAAAIASLAIKLGELQRDLDVLTELKAARASQQGHRRPRRL